MNAVTIIAIHSHYGSWKPASSGFWWIKFMRFFMATENHRYANETKFSWTLLVSQNLIRRRPSYIWICKNESYLNYNRILTLVNDEQIAQSTLSTQRLSKFDFRRVVSVPSQHFWLLLNQKQKHDRFYEFH